MKIVGIDIIRKDISGSQDIPFYDSAQRSFLPLGQLREALRYRELIVQLVRRDLIARYKRSILGIAWTMLNPLGMMIVLTVVFSQIFKTVEGYAAYVLSGLVVWTFFSQSTSNTIGALAWGGDFFRRIYVPPSIFAITSIGTGLVNLMFAMVPLLLVMLVTSVPIRWTILLSVIPVFFLAMFALAVGLLISSIAIYFPDIVEMYQILLMAWMYLTPILYPLNVLPESIRKFVLFNPMSHLINLFRITIYEGRIPTANELIIPAIISVVSLVFAWWVFAYRANEFAYRT
jgi:ABC-2 type transport system permease protein